MFLLFIPGVLHKCTSRAKSPLGRWLREDVTWTGSCLFSVSTWAAKSDSFTFSLQVPRLVKVVLESSPYFKLISPTDVCRKVAPGMPSTFRILFTPEENKVRPEVPGGWCLLVECEPMGLDLEQMRRCGFVDFSWFQWGCAGFRTGRKSFSMVEVLLKM